MDVLCDPAYMSDLRRKCYELESRVKIMEKEQKGLIQDQARREKRLDKIIGSGCEPEGLKEL